MGEPSTYLSPLGIPAEDLQRCHDMLGMSSWQTLAGKSIFITGGTGFIGKWLLASLLDADKTLGLDCRITVLSRDAPAFERSWPAITGQVNWIAGDVRDFPIGSEHFDVIIHAATDVVSQVSSEDVFSTCLDGTRRVLELASNCGASRLLLVSSGAIYGPLPSGMTHVPETHLGGPDPLLASSAYAEGKRVSEWLCAQASVNVLQVKIARVFALVGPHLPLNKHFAIGNFIRDAMKGEPIKVKYGTPYRSYLYAADLAVWLWTILFRGKACYPYNVGSDQEITISQLAETVVTTLGGAVASAASSTLRFNTSPSRYVSSVERARAELGLRSQISLEEGIRKTAAWYHDLQ
jgi:dTDP-glucose 4,6-dehydratase